ncbi:MAG TPA: hypothetical protein VH255_01700 [Verrucomicrobiae bacterium]|jgi:hypothetical protein|nr:hypothetical protein [Verrucomicrobiae bacterium]
MRRKFEVSVVQTGIMEIKTTILAANSYEAGEQAVEKLKRQKFIPGNIEQEVKSVIELDS